MEWKDKKVLVNGASGFIGSALSKEFLKRGAKVYSIDYSINKVDVPDKRIFIIGGDVSKKETWENVPEEIDYIFHFASPSSVTLFKKEPEKCFNVTFLGLYYAFEFAKKNGVKKIIYPSTGNVYSGNEPPHVENVFPKPQNLYTASKVACEALANSYADFVKSIGLRISAGYGPGEERKKGFGSPVLMFLRDLMEGRSPEIWGDGNQTRDLLYIDDLIKMVIKSAEIDYIGVLNVGSGESITFKELIGKINKILNKNLEPIFIPKEINYVENINLDLNLNKKLLDIKPLSVEEGLKKFINYLSASS